MPEPVMTGEKACGGECGLTKSVLEFHIRRASVDGRNYECKVCSCKRRKDDRDANPEKFRQRNRDYRANDPEKVAAYHRNKNLQREYGITAAQWDEIFEAQGRCCAICKGQTPRDKLGRGWHVDHDHATGRVRGILCLLCNWALGYFKDDPTILGSAIDYLEKNNGRQTTCGNLPQNLIAERAS
jgi:hypothetical protein